MSSRVHCYSNAYVDKLRKTYEFITQLQNYFLRGRSKREGGTDFANFILLQDKREMDERISMEKNAHNFNTKIDK